MSLVSMAWHGMAYGGGDVDTKNQTILVQL